MRYEFGGLIHGGAYYFRSFVVYYISLLSFAQRLKKRRITYVELEITFFNCLKTLHFELTFAFVVQVLQVKIICRLNFFNRG